MPRHLSKAKNTSVAGVVEAGIAESEGWQGAAVWPAGNLIRSGTRLADKRLTVWEVAQHLIARLEQGSEDRSRLSCLRRRWAVEWVTGPGGSSYLLYQIADREGSGSE